MKSTGDGLDLFFQCKYTPCHEWMMFAAWYSIRKNLPDANVIITCERAAPGLDLFGWARKDSISFFQYASDLCSITIAENRDLFTGTERLVFTKPNVVALGEYDSMDPGPISAKSNGRATFVDYEQGCGNFVESEWIDRYETPFDNAFNKFGNFNLSPNELAVLRLWEKIKPMFSMIKEG